MILLGVLVLVLGVLVESVRARRVVESSSRMLDVLDVLDVLVECSSRVLSDVYAHLAEPAARSDSNTGAIVAHSCQAGANAGVRLRLETGKGIIPNGCSKHCTFSSQV